ncbi:hypothetical protein B0H14DRAFT_2439582 [Mycena olivaceomarginata]|nr:hypothetical protein B0H14DRAFT_2439582 [Mycena olivaceomarginata]
MDSCGQPSPQTVASAVFSQCATHSTQLHSNYRLQRVSSLLADTRNRRSYQLNVVQHPQKAAEFGYENLSRLSLTPPMVVQLTVRDMNGNSIAPEELPFLIAHLSLFTQNGMTTGSAYRQGALSPILYGTSARGTAPRSPSLFIDHRNS